MSIFKQNQIATIGTEKNPPKGGTPWKARVIVTNAHNRDNMTVIALVQQDPTSTYEQVMSFDDKGLCLLAANRGENESHYLDSNLYPIE